MNIIKTNHLPHMQETLNEIKAGQEEAAKQATENTREIVAAVRASQDAIVQAIISTKGS